MNDIAANYVRIREEVAAAAVRCGRRPESITIVCAAKTKGPEAVQAALAAGATDIGENYVQEAQQKMKQVTLPARWHLIGHLQRNKTKLAIQLFTMIHSLDSAPLAQELHRQCEKHNTTVRTLIEVNLGGEPTKSGIAPEGVESLLETVAALPRVRVEGFMTVPPPSPNPEAARLYFRTLAQLCQRYERFPAGNIELKELSMGMTDDYLVAIEEGATMVRIGRAIFGER
ncbi:MAG TPA: YggS family pyridoxal phosphate-dependent enzyme [Methylomirabilota bacterium]|jgi:pyridoxal phosphate enzyme (YggS family)|nr:YggS family pyridoxal phosphate-dependent enzyme [Methylomirabilota bacterium]